MNKHSKKIFKKIVSFVFVFTTMFFVTQRIFAELRKECPPFAEEYRKVLRNLLLGIILLGMLFWLLHIRGVF
jgi:preprotein translocase subunit Sss1